jgi:hypothetical protein
MLQVSEVKKVKDSTGADATLRAIFTCTKKLALRAAYMHLIAARIVKDFASVF